MTANSSCATAAHAIGPITYWPTLAEIPSPNPGANRAGEDFMRLALIPSDDAGVRAIAVKLFLLEEHNSNAQVRDMVSSEDILRDLSAVPAKTPGGISWKIAEALDYFRDDNEWPWWRYLLQSAMVDALELERARAAAVFAQAADPDAELKRLWQKAQDARTQANAANDEKCDLLVRDVIHPAQVAVAELPANTVAGLSVKLQMLVEDLTANSESVYRRDLIATLLGAAERLAPGSAIYRPKVDRDADEGEETAA